MSLESKLLAFHHLDAIGYQMDSTKGIHFISSLIHGPASAIFYQGQHSYYCYKFGIIEE